MKSKKINYKKQKQIKSKVEKSLGKRLAPSFFLLVVAGVLVVAGYSSKFTGYEVSKMVCAFLEGSALRIITPAMCLKSDSDILQEIKNNAADNAVKTSLWIISPGGSIDASSEDNYALSMDPMYANYIELKNQLNDVAEGDESPEIEAEIAVEETTETVNVPETKSAVETIAATEEVIDQPVSGLPVATGSVYSLEQLKDFNFLKNSFYYVHNSTTVTPEQLNPEALLAKDLSIEKDSSVPQILIYHTHAYEAFADSVEGGEDMTIVGAGNYLTDLLTNVYGYNVIHDTTLYSYNDAYSLALAHVSEILEANPSIQLVIDLHRDAAGEGTRLVTEVNGKPTAKIMFFNGMCQTVDGPLDYVSNPYLEGNLAMSLQMKLLAEEYYPGFTRKNFLKAYRYNQHLMERSMLVEAGANTNTFAEVKNAMEPLAALLNEVLSGSR